MQVAYISDLHLDTYFDNNDLLDEFALIEADILILAGDIAEFTSFSNYTHFFNEVSKLFNHVLWVAGNHEYYGSSVTDTLLHEKICKELPDNFIFLHNNLVTIDGYKFYGGTLWCDANEIPMTDRFIMKQMLHDINVIKHEDKLITWEKIGDMYNEFIENLIDVLLDYKVEDKLVIISHFAPSLKSVTPRFAGSSLNPYFCNELDTFIENSKVDFWIHGHVHSNHNYMIGDTNVLCNPRGYPREIDNANTIEVITI